MIPLAIEMSEPVAVLAIVLAVTAGGLLAKVSRCFAGRSSSLNGQSEPGDAAPPDRSRGELFDELAQWETRLRDTAEDVAGQWEATRAGIEVLITQADRAAARLEAALAQGQASQVAEQSATPGGEPPEVFEAMKDSSCASGTPIVELSGPPSATPNPAARRRDEVRALADQGLDCEEIARRAGCPIGEVELILSLRGRQ